MRECHDVTLWNATFSFCNFLKSSSQSQHNGQPQREISPSTSKFIYINFICFCLSFWCFCSAESDHHSILFQPISKAYKKHWVTATTRHAIHPNVSNVTNSINFQSEFWDVGFIYIFRMFELIKQLIPIHNFNYYWEDSRRSKLSPWHENTTRILYWIN